MPTKDKMHSKGVEHTVLRVGTRGGGQGVRGSWNGRKKEVGCGGREGGDKKTGKMTSDKDEILRL